MKDERTPRGALTGASATAFSAIQAPSPALPKGGGAIRGLGETFRVSPATGTCAFEVPLGLTSGRQGFGPSLSLSYDSGAGNGPFGVGWQLSAAAITRKTDKGIPQYGDIDGTDTFLLAGFEDLVPSLRSDGAPDVVQTPEHVATRFRPRVEGAFARIERRWSKATGVVHWRVTTRDNVTHIYGEVPDARIVHPSVPKLVFSWLLERSEDDRGNVVLYEYKMEDLDGVPPKTYEDGRREGRAPFTNRYLKRIRYGNTVPFDRTGQSCQLEAVLDYGEHDPEQPTPAPAPGRTWPARQDPFSWHRAGFEIRTYRLCRRVLMFHHFPELGPEPTLVRSLDLGYEENPTLTRLTSVTQKGYLRPAGSTGAYSTKAFPPLELGYTASTLHREVELLNPDDEEELSARVLGEHQWVDLEGEGLPGVLSEQGGALFYRRNEGRGRLAPARRLPVRPALAAGITPQVMDVGGDGQMDLVQYAPGAAGYHERTPDDGWGPFVPFASQPRIDWNDPNLRFLDLNGDGLDDLLLVGETTYTWYPSIGKRGFGPPRTFVRGTDSDRGPTAVFAAARHQAIFLADMTGDGLRDIVRIANGNISYWPNQGHGKFGAKVQMSGAPHFTAPCHFDARRIRLGDVDGSGTMDLLYLGGEGGVRVWFNQAGNGWSAEHKLHVYPDAMATVEVLDLLGTGTACLVWSSPLKTWIQYVDLCGGKKPHLLASIKNNLGLETRMAYAPSTRFYLADRAAGRPWVTRLPFPVHVLERVETYDHVSRVRLVSEYRYHHGHYDGDERELRGFGMVEQVDTEAFSAARGKGLFPEVTPLNGELPQPPVLTKTWFHTGSWRLRAAISRQFEKEYYALDEEAPRLPDTMLPAGLTVEERKQACRALRGQVLRQEVYALDGSPREGHPYSVVESSFVVRREQPPKGKAPGVFFVAPREARSLYYERYRGEDGKADPRTTHALTLEVDEYGTVRKSAAVAYPRRRVPSDPDFAAQGKLAVTLTETEVVHLANAPGGRRLAIPVETRTYEMHGLAAPAGVFSFEQIAAIYTRVPPVPQIDYEDWPPEEGEPPPSGPRKRLIERVRVRYYDSAHLPSPLAFGSADLRALPYESYQLALTTGQIEKTFNATAQRVTPAILAEGGYVQLGSDPGWWIPSGRQMFDPARFYLPTSFVDPFNNTTAVEYDTYAQLVTRTEDALGNEVLVENDYRTLSAATITDPNGNRAAVRFDELGMVVATAVMGKAGSNDGDTLDDPTTTLEYDLFRFQTAGRPNFVRVRARETHRDPATRWQESYSYSDGSGHELMRKVQAEPGPAPELDGEGHVIRDADGKPVMTAANPRWVGTGRTVFDNKGNPIKKYEPYFSRTHEYDDDEELMHWGVTPILRYDPLGRLIRTDLPDGTFSQVTFDPWKQTSYDPNDTVLQSAWYAARQVLPPGDPGRRAADLAAAHADTPAVTHLDALGRVFRAVADNGPDGQYVTETLLDIEGHPLVITDARGNQAMLHRFGLGGQFLSQQSNDGGKRWMLADATGQMLRTWNERGFTYRASYDVLRRPTHRYVQPAAGPERLTQRILYGEDHPQAVALNLRGRPYQAYDGAGVATTLAYDFKGNPLEASRRLRSDSHADADWSALAALTDVAAVAVAAEPLLDAESFPSQTAYDALDRPTSLITPEMSEVRPTYNEASLLERVEARVRGAAAWTIFVDDIDYDAKGRRERIDYGNGTATVYTYDPLTFRLTRLKTTRAPDNAVLQNLAYAYDPVGNITEIGDSAQQTVFFNNAVVSPSTQYVYDALYRLTQATGREHAGGMADVQRDRDDVPIQTLPHPNDAQALRSYTEQYVYDAVGNILQIIHQAGAGSWTRRYAYDASSNRLLSTSVPGDPANGPYSAAYTHDVHGNMTSMPHIAAMTWDENDQVRTTDLGGGGVVYSTYDAAGQRVRKVWEHSGLIEERIYLGGYEVYRKRDAMGLLLERQTLHVMDDARRVAMVETKTVDTSGPLTVTPRVRYQLDNHLGSASLEVDGAGLLIGYEEYHPYGTTAYWSAASGIEVSQRRYRYTGKEKDEETGLYYYGARYYAQWLGRWTAADPIGLKGGINLFAYVSANPIKLIDPNGTDPKATYLGSSKEEKYVARLEKTWSGNQYWSDTGEHGAGWYVKTEGSKIVPGPPSEATPPRVVAAGKEGLAALEEVIGRPQPKAPSTVTQGNLESAHTGMAVLEHSALPKDAARSKEGTEVIFWDATGTGQASFGHVSVVIDDMSYSFGPPGDVAVLPRDEYFRVNLPSGGATGLELDLTEEQKAGPPVPTSAETTYLSKSV